MPMSKLSDLEQLQSVVQAIGAAQLEGGELAVGEVALEQQRVARIVFDEENAGHAACSSAVSASLAPSCVTSVIPSLRRTAPCGAPASGES